MSDFADAIPCVALEPSKRRHVSVVLLTNDGIPSVNAAAWENRLLFPNDDEVGKSYRMRNEMALCRKIPQLHTYANDTLLTGCSTHFPATVRELKSPFSCFHKVEVLKALLTADESTE